MAFIVLRKTRSSRSYYLVESYRDETGRSRKRTLAYLGSEADAVATLEGALSHWQRHREQMARSFNAYRGKRRAELAEKIASIDAKLAMIRLHLDRKQAAEAEKRERERIAEEAAYWQDFERLRRHPSEDHYRAAKRAYRKLALRYHPDQGGDHAAFIRLQRAYEGAVARYRRAA